MTITFQRWLPLLVCFFLWMPAEAAPPQSLNPEFFGTWNGTAPVHLLCSGGNQNKRGDGKITIHIDRPKVEPGKNPNVFVHANLGCMAELKLPGFVFFDEIWASSDDRMTVIRLSLQGGTMSGNFRMDLNGHTLKMDFHQLKN